MIARMRWLVGALSIMWLHLAAQGFNFAREAFVFGLFAGQETDGGAAFGGNTGGRELIEVGVFVVAVFEVAGLDVAFSQQGFEAVVDFADTDAELPSQLALG